MGQINRLSALDVDYLKSQLLSYADVLDNVLYNIEHSNEVDNDYVGHMLFELEKDIRQLRKKNLVN